jgi:hypothetical protein
MRKLIGTLSPSLVNLDSPIDIRLPGNHISGTVPTNLTAAIMVMGAQINGSHGDDGTSLLPLLPKIRRK